MGLRALRERRSTLVTAVPRPGFGRSHGGKLLGIARAEAQSILQAVAGGMIAFAGLVVSVAVVVQFGAGQYSPRLVHVFRRDTCFGVIR